MAFPQVNHSILEATFKGTSHRTNEGTAIHSFRGVPYARIPARFEYAQLIDKYADGVVNATTYGPRCPQVYLDVRHLLRIPEDIEMKLESEDEFGCLNLDITSPPLGEEDMGCLPVVIWIHGGSQVVTFCSAASGICDPTKLVTDSIQRKQPMVFVTVNYRLNIFGFGDGKEKNLGLKDQRLAIEWVRRNIAPFGGDPENITLAGESAGAVYTHAHLITGPPVKRAVLASGSLYLSSPLPVERGNALIKALEAKVQGFDQSSLREASASTLVRALEECNINTMWLQEEPELQNWGSKQEQVEEVMIGDAEFESVIWRNGIESLDAASITAAFDTQPPIGPDLRKLYQVVPSRPTASKLGALDLVHDARYSLPVELISESLQTRGTTVYKYVIDQPNPWQPSSRSHHAVDLLFLFGGVDLSFNPGAESIGQEMRWRWILFVNGKLPWSEQRRFAYGPLGECREIDEAQFAARRRVGHINALRQAGRDAYMAIVGALTAGKISLLN